MSKPLKALKFEAFCELYQKNMKERVKLSTWKMKESVIESKILPYFRKKRMCDIKPRAVVTWQTAMLKICDDDGEPYSPVYFKTIHNQLSAINHAVKFYDLPNNLAKKAGNVVPSKSFGRKSFRPSARQRGNFACRAVV